MAAVSAPASRLMSHFPSQCSHSSGGFPVLILHGLFQSSGSFVTSEDRSLAFWLAKHGGYQVYLGNTRGIFDMGHRNFSRNDPRFWGELRPSTSLNCKAVATDTCRLDHQRTGNVRSARIGRACLPRNGIRQGPSLPLFLG